MSGKQKSANRTKNNARPSSSGRSAELLESSLPPFSGLTGFSVSSADELDPNLDANFLVVLKKVAKKDSTTKLKGLQEFAALVKSSELETVQAVLPSWPRVYCNLATDADNRVREAVHNVHHQIVLKVKREIAPYLKQLMAPWFTSQYDTYPPAATAALKAFKAAFTPNKIEEAIIFCQVEILTYIKENLLDETALSASNKNLSVEDAEAKNERVLISCLHGYYLYLTQVPTEEIQKNSLLNNCIVSSEKFWNFAKNNVPPIRLAWYKVLTALCQKAAFLLEDKGTELTSNIFGNLEEAEPTVLPYVWEAALLVMSTIKDWWTYIDVEKMFVAKLFHVLKNGGQGNASAVFPSLLPILSHLPPSLESNPLMFYHNFFQHLQTGLKQKTVCQSRGESAAVATALLECLKYVIMKNLDKREMCVQLIKHNVIQTVGWCLLNDQFSYKILFNQIAVIVQYWSRNSEQSEDYAFYLQYFFENISKLFTFSLRDNVEDNFDLSATATKQVSFLKSLKHMTNPKKAKVKFVSRQDSQEKNSGDEETTTEQDTLYIDKLNSFVFSVGKDYVTYIEEYHSEVLVEHLYTLIVSFDTENFFRNLQDSLEETEDGDQVTVMFNNTLLKWLKSDLCCQHIVDLTFILWQYVDEKDKEMILRTLTDITSEECLSWCISKALSFPYNKEPLVQQWLKSPNVSKWLVSIAEKEMKQECSRELRSLLKLSLTENESGELYIENSALCSIVDKLVEMLVDLDEHKTTANACAKLAASVATAIYTDSLLLTYGDALLLSLFQLSYSKSNNVLYPDARWEITMAWRDAVTILTKSLSKTQTTNLTHKFADVVEELFFQADPNVDQLRNMVIRYLRSIYKSIPILVSDTLGIFMDRSFVPRYHNDVLKVCQIAEFLKGNFASPYEEISCEGVNINEHDIWRYFTWMDMKAAIGFMSLHDAKQGNKDNVVLVINALDNNAEFLAETIHCYCLCESFIPNYKNTRYHQMLLEILRHWNITVLDKIGKFDKDFMSKVELVLRDRVITHGWFWCQAVYHWYLPAKSEALGFLLRAFLKTLPNIPDNNLSVIHFVQALCEFLTVDDIFCQLNAVDPVGSVILLRCMISRQDIDVQIAEVFGKIENMRNANTSQFLFENSSNIPWKKSQEIAEIVRLCSKLMQSGFDKVGRRHWDFAVLSLVSWSANAVKARAQYENYSYQNFILATVELFINISKQMEKLKHSDSSNDYYDEWKNLFLESIHQDVAQLWLYLTEQFHQKTDIQLVHMPLLYHFGAVIEHLNHELIFKMSNTSMPKWTKFLKRSCSMLINSLPVLQLWGYKMLLELVPGLVEIDCKAVQTNTPHKKGLIFEQFKEKLVQTQEIVNAMLEEFKLGEKKCTLRSFTDSFTYTFAYLLLWDVLLELCRKSSTEVRYQYADWLRNEDLLTNFLNNIFRLMPWDFLHVPMIARTKPHSDLIMRKPDITVSDNYTSDNIESLVCWLYITALEQLPALVRQWWTALEPRFAQVVERATSFYVSPHLCQRELTDITRHETKFKNMVVKVIPTVREVVAVYTVDEAQMELQITLPANYPLGAPAVQCNRQIGGATQKQWLLQLKKCLLHQNGRIWDGLSIWNNNLDKKFDGVEECYICFAVLHPGTYQLPKLSCQTCKKKFHSACLYKWFSTSNKSSCPICRNLF